MSGTLIQIQPNGEINKTRWEGKGRPPLEMFQSAVDGYIEPVRARWEGITREAYVNEEGRLRGLPINLEASRRSGFQPLVGNMVIWIPDPRKKI